MAEDEIINPRRAKGAVSDINDINEITELTKQPGNQNSLFAILVLEKHGVTGPQMKGERQIHKKRPFHPPWISHPIDIKNRLAASF